MIEPLECRRLFSRAVVGLSHGMLNVVGTERADTILVSCNTRRVMLSVNGDSASFPLAHVRVVRINGGARDDTIQADESVDLPLSVDGGTGSDRINGSNVNDTLAGGSGGDFIYGRRGNDYLDGGPGNDLLEDTRGTNVIHGGSGTDRCHTDRYAIGSGVELGTGFFYGLTTKAGRTYFEALVTVASQSLSDLTIDRNGHAAITLNTTTIPGNDDPTAEWQQRDVTAALATGFDFVRTLGEASFPELSVPFLLPSGH